jgi:omega-6 fatty acid desaturase (delta-12 desaturase)
MEMMSSARSRPVTPATPAAAPRATSAAAPAAPGIRDVKAAIPEGARTRSVLRGVSAFTLAYAFWLAAFAALLLAPSWWLKALAGGVVGFGAAVLFVIGHDACHGALTPRSRLNAWLGRFAFGPSLHPLVAWEHSHNVLHHGWTNLRGKDPAYPPFSRAEYDALPRWRRRLERIYRSELGIALFYLVEIWWKLEMSPSREHRGRIEQRGSFRFDRGFVLLFLGAELAALVALSVIPGGGVRLAPGTLAALLGVGFAWPYLAWNWMAGFFTFQHHTHPKVAWYADAEAWSFYHGQVEGTVHVEFSWLVEFLLNNIMQHTAHHVDPKIPLYHLLESQQALEERFGTDMTVEKWSFRGYRELFRICQLYDYEKGRWISYDGEPTSASVR